MIVPAELSRKHAVVKPYLSVVEGTVRDILRKYADDRGYAYIGRLKNTESLAEKIETGRFPTWLSLDDLYACCVIVPTLQEEPEALDFLKTKFSIVGLKSRGTAQKDPSTFRFDATRFIGRIGSELLPQASPEVLGIQFEVQIRTAFEHAWSAATHALAYKGGKVDWRRLRLAAQLKASVEQMDALISGYDNFIGSIAPQQWPDVQAKQEIEEFFRERFNNGQLFVGLEPSSWLRFCDNFLVIVLSSKPRYVRDKVASVKEALNLVAKELDCLTPDQIPRSLSLLQFCIGALTKRGGIAGPLSRYIPLITTELKALYPQVSSLGPGFDVG
jgi:ppGpp synthetase/RelA/SpoT-type nucleotidyltranferase